jgi:methionyl-tRNA formyltransferase
VENLKSDSFAQQLKTMEADLFVVVAFRILPPAILGIPARGSVNLHASLLPKYRGAAPIHHAVMNGEKETGCTVFMLDEQVDTGRIIRQQPTPISKNETTGDVYDRLKQMGSSLLLEAVNDIETESYSPRRQDDAAATAAPKIFTDDCKIDFNKPAGEVHNKIRGLSPFPTAWAQLDSLKFNIYRSKIGPEEELKAGQLQLHDRDLLVGCGDGTVNLEEVQLQGKRKMSGFDFMNGYSSGTGVLR